MSVKPFPLYTDGQSVFYTTDGINFNAVSAPTSPASSTTNGLMTAAQFSALAGLQASKSPGAVQVAFTDVIDLVGGTLGAYVIIPPTPARLIPLSKFWEIKTTTGASVGPTYSIGSNSSSFNNICASQTTATLASQAAETLLSPASISPVPAVDLTASGLQLNFTVAATATALTARLGLAYMLFPL